MVSMAHFKITEFLNFGYHGNDKLFSLNLKGKEQMF